MVRARTSPARRAAAPGLGERVLGGGSCCRTLRGGMNCGADQTVPGGPDHAASGGTSRAGRVLCGCALSRASHPVRRDPARSSDAWQRGEQRGDIMNGGGWRAAGRRARTLRAAARPYRAAPLPVRRPHAVPDSPACVHPPPGAGAPRAVETRPPRQMARGFGDRADVPGGRWHASGRVRVRSCARQCATPHPCGRVGCGTLRTCLPGVEPAQGQMQACGPSHLRCQACCAAMSAPPTPVQPHPVPQNRPPLRDQAVTG